MNTYIQKEVATLKNKFNTCNPFELIELLGINLMYKDGLGSLKGFYYTLLRERYIVINSNIDAPDIVAAHELGHDRLHRHLANVPMRDYRMFGNVDKTEHQANLFAAELLISDEAVSDNPGDDYYAMCRELGFPPLFVAYKVYSMSHRGYDYTLPENLNSRFLKW